MPRIFDNINEKLWDSLKYTAQKSVKADFCIGYFNLRGWRLIAEEIDGFSGKNNHGCRVLIGMQKLPAVQLYEELKIAASQPERMDNNTAVKLKKIMAQEFRQQLMVGVPNVEDEKGLQKLRQQLLAKKVVVKLHLRYPLHAKLYLFYQGDNRDLPLVGYLGSSNLTFSGLKTQGELNIDVLDHDATNKLKIWFQERWQDRFCLDISAELAAIIDESWAREELIPPYYIYLKMAYHLSQEARDGLSQYSIPPEFNLFDFQEAAVKIAAHHVNGRGGVIVGDVVGLGKTIVGTAIARIIEEDFGISTLIICPKNLVPMWEKYRDEYGLRAKVLSISKVVKELPNIPARFRLVLIDESHNLRNREGQRYAAIKEYIEQSGSRCILLTATPYNKSFLDLSAQLRLFINENTDLGIKPEVLMSKIDFAVKYSQISPRSLSAFDKSEYSEDWQQLMSRYMVRRTRGFIRDNYAKFDTEKQRRYLEFSDGKRSYFPDRIPKTATFKLENSKLGNSEEDAYANLYSNLYSSWVVDIINKLNLPRYGLGNYEKDRHKEKPTATEQKILNGLSRAGRNLMGFCRTNLFKRLESSGYAFTQSLERHILRNFIYLYAIKSNLDLPIGTQDAQFLITALNDEDSDSVKSMVTDAENQTDEDELDLEGFGEIERQAKVYEIKAEKVYQLYQTKYQRKFKWLRPNLFKSKLKKDLREDAYNLIAILQKCPNWNQDNDQKLWSLWKLLTQQHPEEKVLVFSQFADTVRYLGENLQQLGLTQFATVTGDSNNPTELAYCFSPNSNNKSNNKANNKAIAPEQELRVLIATDVLSEGQNLQDCRIIVNYDLPWAIIRLIQRAGRVDRIGQKAATIYCYSFLPAEGVERLINLRGRLIARLEENAEVVGTDEVFFEEMVVDEKAMLDLYHEKAGILDDLDDLEVDLTSEALNIWENAKEKYPNLAEKIEQLPNVVFSTRQINPPPTPHLKGGENEEKETLQPPNPPPTPPLKGGENEGIEETPEGVLMYMRTVDGVDALAYVNKEGKSVTQSQSRILRLARCELETPAIQRHPKHYQLVEKGTEIIREQQKKMTAGGKLGSPNSARAKTYERLNSYVNKIQKEMPLLAQGSEWESLVKAIENILKYPLKESAMVKLNRQLKTGITDEQLANMVVSLGDNDALCVMHENEQVKDSQIICSLGLFQEG